MKRVFLLLVLAVFGTHIMAENLNINGSVIDENGNPVIGHEVYLSSSDSLSGFFYSAMVYTDDAGLFSEVIALDADITQGEILASTESCNDYLMMTQFFNPGNYVLDFAFEICTDTTGSGGGNDSIIQGCENYFYYNQNGLDIAFFGGVNQEGDVTFSWDFGDGTSGDGMEVSHSYSLEGTYSVSLQTVLNDTCDYTSYQTIYVTLDSTGGGNDSTNCQNVFESMIEDMTLTVWAYGLDGYEISDYYWDFGDGTATVEGEQASHEYASEGDYLVTLTTIGVDSCIAISSQWMSLPETTSGAFLWGQVTVENMPLDFGMASLYSILSDTIGGDDIVLYDEVQVDSAGSYYFENVPEGNYLILAQADPASMYYESSFPTYYGDVIYWLDASIIVLGEAANPYHISLQTGSGANEGEGLIDGNLIGDDFKNQLINEEVSLFLLDENNIPLELTYSEVNESFDFSNLAFGNYLVYAEVIGLTTEVASISLNAENPVAHIGIYITPNGVTTAIDELGMQNIELIGDLYPNPVKNKAYIDLEIKENTSMEILILNQLGQLIYRDYLESSVGTQRIELPTHQLMPGLYFVQIRSHGNEIFNQKMIK